MPALQSVCYTVGMKLPRLKRCLPSWKNAVLSIVSAVLLILAFPDFEYWLLAWFALIPLFGAIEREKESVGRSFVLGWIWGFVFFTGTCWWLTFAPITYAGFPPIVAYFLLLCLTAIVGIFPGIFASIFSVLLKRYGNIAILAAPFVWVFSEFLRYWLTGNNWNAIGYSQAFVEILHAWAPAGGILLVGFAITGFNASLSYAVSIFIEPRSSRRARLAAATAPIALTIFVFWFSPVPRWMISDPISDPNSARVVAIQPNVPMSGLTFEKWKALRQKHVELAESALATINDQRSTNTTVIFPESPMNFAYEEDEEFQKFRPRVRCEK